jgi:hypothetical protein
MEFNKRAVSNWTHCDAARGFHSMLKKKLANLSTEVILNHTGSLRRPVSRRFRPSLNEPPQQSKWMKIKEGFVSRGFRPSLNDPLFVRPGTFSLAVTWQEVLDLRSKIILSAHFL